MPDESIAAVLNRTRKSTAAATAFVQAVCSLRHHGKSSLIAEGDARSCRQETRDDLDGAAEAP